MIHLLVHLHATSEAHLTERTKRLVHEFIIILKERSKWIFSSEEILEYIVSVPHVEIMEVRVLEMVTTEATMTSSSVRLRFHTTVFYIFSAVRVIILSFLSIT